MSDFGGRVQCATHPMAAADASGATIAVMPSNSPVSPARPDSPQGEGVDHSRRDSRATIVDPTIIDEIREQWRRRQAWHRAEKSLTLQAKALCRRLVEGSKTEADALYKSAISDGEHELADVAFAAIAPLVEARKGIETARKAVEKRLAVLAKQLPVAPWVADTKGLGFGGLAAIVGEAGDLSGYATVARLWKRMGLAVMSDGTRQRRVGGAEAFEHGYAPARRSVIWTIGDSMIKTRGAYREVYDERKVIEAKRTETAGHAHNRAKRYMEKRMLRELWVAWRAGETTGPV